MKVFLNIVIALSILGITGNFYLFARPPVSWMDLVRKNDYLFFSIISLAFLVWAIAVHLAIMKG